MIDIGSAHDRSDWLMKHEYGHGGIEFYIFMIVAVIAEVSHTG